MSDQRQSTDRPHLLSTSEAAALLCVHPNTLRRWADFNLLPSFRIGPRRDRRFLRKDIEDHLADMSCGLYVDRPW